MDRISELPDCVLSYILSMLPIKDLLKTSILSTRWFNLWLLRTDLNFDIPNMLGEIETIEYGSGIPSPSLMERKQYQEESVSIQFVQRVNQFLQKFNNSTSTDITKKIDSLRVAHSLNSGQSGSIDRWISFAITWGVERIDLIFKGPSNVCASKLYVFPLLMLFSNSTNSTLKHINLHSCILPNTHIPPPVAATANLVNNNPFRNNPFRNLRSLVLNNVHILGGQDLITNLLSRCVQLEELCLFECQFPLLKNRLKIVSPSLLHLKFHQFRQNQISFHCDKLSSLECYGNTLWSPRDIYWCYQHILSCCCPTKAPLLKRVLFHIHPTSAMADILASLANLPQLEILSLDVGQTVNISLVENSLRTLPPFKNLKQLNLLIDGEIMDEELEFEFDNLWIFTILKACPLLQKLSITVFSPKLLANQKESRDLGMFSHSELKVVEVGGCIGNWYEIEFAMNILKYADKLEQIIMSPFWKYPGSPDSKWYSSNVEQFPNGWEMAREKLRCCEIAGQAQFILI